MSKEKTAKKLRKCNQLAGQLSASLDQVQQQLDSIVTSIETIREMATEMPHPYDMESFADVAKKAATELERTRDAWNGFSTLEADS